MNAVEFEHFSYAYPGNSLSLDDINIIIPQGSFTVITGQSGAGKTTLALAIAGVVPHYFGGRQGGLIRVDGVNSMERSMGETAAQVGTVLADYESQLVAITVAEEVAFGLETSGLNRGQVTQRISQTLTMVGLAGMEDRTVAGLSGGQKQRLAIAAVLAMEPEIMVLDEPASALDPEGAAGVYELLYNLNCQGKTIIVVEHQLARVLPYASQIVLLTGGKVAYAGDMGQTLQYMWAQPECRLGVPQLWQLKLTLEEQLGIKFGAWASEQQAASELSKLSGEKLKEVAQSA